MTLARGGRLPLAIDAAMERLNTSVDVDAELWREDIAGSIAHARGLGRAGLLSDDEVSAIVGGLERIREEIEAGSFRWDPAREDVHMNIEARLVEIIGPVGGQRHTGRSRNDQVATALRLYCRRRGDEALASIAGLACVRVARAPAQADARIARR